MVLLYLVETETLGELVSYAEKNHRRMIGPTHPVVALTGYIQLHG